MTEELIHDRISFWKFLDIREDDDIPDEATICKFRNALMREGLLSWIFEVVKSMMEARRLIVHKGTIVDATIFHAQEPKKHQDKESGTSTNVAYDSDARYTSKHGRKYHGYKYHIATDKNGVITKLKVTPANENDSNQFEYLTAEEKHAVFADSGYMGKERKQALRKAGICCGIIERRVRGQKSLRKKQLKNNRRIAAIRGLVEYPFDIIKRVMRFTEIRYRGLYKNSQHVFLIAAAYNLYRMESVMVQQAV